jgi:GNAT superfamily N-acetyltransferase
MDSGYFKRFRMELTLGVGGFPAAPPSDASSPTEMLENLPSGYRLVPWHEGLIDAHARTKFRSFRSEIDAVVFPCLGDLEGCRRLMREIRGKGGFLPGATWLIARSRPLPAGLGPDTQASRPAEVEWCGTIQGVIDSSGAGSIQNIGVVPGHRGRGLGSYLIAAAMRGFTEQSLPRATLEVTADNVRAVSLYQRLGFRRVKTIYKVVDNASWQFQEREPALL